MSEQVVVRGPGEGRSLLVGGSDYVTYEARGAETAAQLLDEEWISFGARPSSSSSYFTLTAALVARD